MRKETLEIPMVIGGERVLTGDTSAVVLPHEHATQIARAHKGDRSHVERAIAAAGVAKHDWARLPWQERAAVFLRAADLLTGAWRNRSNASTMLGQSKTVYQAEIDAVCELADFFRFNVHFLSKLMEEQPISPPGSWNRVELRPLDGFVLAISPFNFSSIALNLPSAPALLGNTVLWKPAPTQLHSAYIGLQLLEAAGLPPGVINLVHGAPEVIGETALDSEQLAGIHFTGSTATFQKLWGMVGRRIDRYAQYPRIVGETGGKDFIFAHASADPDALITAIIRGGFEFQGQKCSAASRVYVPKSVWSRIKAPLAEQIQNIAVGDIEDFTNFMGAVIDDRAFEKIRSYLELAKADADCSVIAGGRAENARGFFVYPTLVQTLDPKHRLMREEIFGPVVTTYVYEDGAFEETLELCDQSTPYGLTGAVFATDRHAVQRANERLRFAAGNFYVNDKPTGAVVGQQPFGGSRASGTNDKAGSAWNLMRWASPRAIKETLAPPTDYRYSFMGER
jgi:1-pyrroline-5-carboxylate dehydrogenase